jgi:hypothetical protein
MEDTASRTVPASAPVAESAAVSSVLVGLRMSWKTLVLAETTFLRYWLPQFDGEAAAWTALAHVQHAQLVPGVWIHARGLA